MPISPTELQAAFKRWRARAWADGQALVLTDLPTRTISALRGRSTCAVGVQALPPAASGKAAQIDLSVETISGYSTVRFFTGLTGQRGATATTMERDLNIVDILDLDKAVPATITWSSRSFPDAVADLLTAAGLTSAEIDSVFDPGSTYTLGPVYTITISTKENILQVWNELMAFGGTAAIVTPSGRVRVVDSPGIPASTSGTVYAAPAVSGEYPIFDAGWQIEGDETTISVFTATGPKTPAGLQPDGTYTATGIVGKPDSKSYRFAQSDAVCAAIAERELRRRARAKMTAWYTAPLNPNLLPGDTVLLRTARIGLSAAAPAFVMEVATDREAGMRVVVSLGPSAVDGYATSTPPPTADFSIQVEHQLVTLAGVPVAAYLVQCRDESRAPTGSTITTRTWAASGPGADPTSGSEPEVLFFFTSLSGASITLTVESSDGETASVTRTPQANTLQILSRVVSVAAGADGWQVLATTAGWRAFAPGPDCTAVPAMNERGALWAGFSSGAIYKSLDALATAPTLSATLPDAIGALFVNESNVLDVLAGAGNRLYRTQNGGALWTGLHTFGGTITDCQSSPSNPSEIRVCAGSSSWLSLDGGATWAAVTTGAGGALMLASAPWGHAVAYDDGAVRFEEGYTVTWSPSAPASLGSITPLLTTAGYIAGEGPDLIRDGSLESMVLTAGAGALYRLLWTGSAFAGTLLTPASGAGPGKLINAAAAYPIGAFDALQIGYGPLGTPISVSVLLAPFGASGADDRIWIYSGGVWRSAAPPVAGAYWYTMAICPLRPLDWLLVGNSTSLNQTPTAAAGGPIKMSDGTHAIAWRSTDGGATWSQLALTSPTTASWSFGQISWDARGEWVVVASETSGQRTAVWRGAAGAVTVIPPSGSDRFLNVGHAHGLDGDLFLTGFSVNSGAYSGQKVVITRSDVESRPSGSGPGATGSPVILPGTRTAFFSDGTLYRASDYRAAQPTAAGLSGIGSTLAALADGTLLVTSGSGVGRITDPSGTPAAALDYAASAATVLVSDAATRTTAAARNAAGGIYLYNGAEWATIPSPLLDPSKSGAMDCSAEAL